MCIEQEKYIMNGGINMAIICKKCHKIIKIEKEEVDIEGGSLCCLTCGNIIEAGLLYYFNKMCKDLKLRYKKAGRKLLNVKLEHRLI